MTYNDDGSKKQDIGSLNNQGLTINGRFRALSALRIASETRKNIADLELAVPNMVEVASNASLKTIFEKLDIFMTDQTSHNLEVDDKISQFLIRLSHSRAALLQCLPNIYVQSHDHKSLE